MESRRPNIIYLFMGNTSNNHIITELIITKNPQSQAEAQKIFERLSKIPDKKIDQRNKISGRDTNYFFTITNNDIFFLVEANQNFAERHVFEMIDDIVREHIHTMVNDKGEMNLIGKDFLRKTVDKYQTSNSFASVENDVNDIKIEMKQAIQSQIKNLNDVSDLDIKSRQIKDGAEVYKKDARSLQRLTWWRNCKLTIIIVAVLIFLVLIIVVPIVTTSKKAIGN